MDNRKFTAEQQLLAVIEGQKSPQFSSADKNLPQAKARKVPAFAPEVIKARLAFLKDSISSAFKNKDTESMLSIVNNLLIVCISVIFIYLGSEIIFKPDSAKQVSDFLAAKKQAKDSPIAIPIIKELAYYRDKLQQRDLFKPKPKAEEVKAADLKEAGPVSRINETLQELKLVGISAANGQEEAYVMIEHVKTEATFFLKAGDEVKGLEVVKILPNKVILSDGIESVELQ